MESVGSMGVAGAGSGVVVVCFVPLVFSRSVWSSNSVLQELTINKSPRI